MLMSVLSPSWSDGCRFDEVLTAWETELLAYENQSGERVSARFKIAVVSRHAPGEYKAMVALASAQAGDDNGRFRNQITDTLLSSAGFSAAGVRDAGGPTPMVIGAIGGGGATTAGFGRGRGCGG